MNLLDLMASDAPSGKMSQASSRPATTPSVVSWARLSGMIEPSLRLAGTNGPTLVWLTDHGRGSRGAFSTLNISAWPNAARVCSLSQVLETGQIPSKYFLSPKACAGILRRAEKRGRVLPSALLGALRQVADGA
jgi:hypothetical protein